MIKLLSANVYLMCLVCSHAFTQNLNLDVNSSAIGANGVVRFNDPSALLLVLLASVGWHSYQAANVNPVKSLRSE